jgi:hypothetical protein
MGLSTSVRFTRFLESLLSLGMKRIDLVSVKYSGFHRFAWREYSPYDMAYSFRKGAYLSHASAVYLHGLTLQQPKVMYVNKEQTQKPQTDIPLSQPAVDRAFKSQARRSEFVFTDGTAQYVLISGKQSGRLGVERASSPSNHDVDRTTLARTLVDIAVRPIYSGGPYQVLEAYHKAREKVNPGDIIETLAKLHYTYPYQQAVGFYMSRTGYPRAALEELHTILSPLNFYLTHGMRATSYDPYWKLFIPQDFEGLNLIN